MAEVLQVPRQPDGQSYYQPSALRRSQPSSSSLFLGTSPSESPNPTDRLSSSPHSSLSSSPPPSAFNFSNSAPYPSPPLCSGLSLEDKYSSENDIAFPDYCSSKYEEVPYFGQNQDFEVPESARRIDNVPDEDPVESTTTDTTRSDSPLPTPTVSDDTAIKEAPSRHVDYLSHEWREEDIWSSWRHIVSQRKVYGQRSRLENASWRTWAKSKYHLRTISPETLNWLKESDVTWLYGPLQPAQSHPLSTGSSGPASQLSKSNSFVHKKPILKKRSMSEVMLQKSLSTSSLLKQAAASIEAQQARQPTKRPFADRTVSDFISTTACPSEFPSRDDYFSTSDSSSSGSTPCDCGQQKRHIRFDEKVEQCIAVECKEGDVEEDESSSSEEEERPNTNTSDSSSDDGLVMMKRKKRPGLGRSAKGSANNSRSSSHNGRKMIETLPASTLKYRTDSPQPTQQQQQQYTFGSGWTSSLSPSPSQETLKPSHPSTNFLLGAEDDRDDATDSSWSFGANNAKSSLGASSGSSDDLPTSISSRRDSVAVTKARQAGLTSANDDDDDVDLDGLRRTNSGMFMPYEEDEDDIMAAGLFGRVSETINTAKDIAHVIWNVGWRK